MPRYTSVARLLAHRARHALGGPADPDAVAADLDLLDGAAAIEAWWWTCDLAGDFGQPNGLCFSPDESRLYVVVSGAMPGASLSRMSPTCAPTRRG